LTVSIPSASLAAAYCSTNTNPNPKEKSMRKLLAAWLYALALSVPAQAAVREEPISK
jgi:hypothetical protein